MTVQTYEGVVEKGEIKLSPGVRLPEKARVYVVVPESAGGAPVRIISPRLAHPEDAADFRLEVREIPADAGV